MSNTDLTLYIQQLTRALLQSVSERDLIIDRAHRLPKPRGVPELAPRDVIARMHIFHIKEGLMQVSRKASQLPDPYQKVKLYADLSQFTIQARKHLQPITVDQTPLPNTKLPH